MDRPPLPPFRAGTAEQKARMAEDAWNLRDPGRVALAYTVDSRWRNRAEMFRGREAIEAFLTRKWSKELDYRLFKEVWAFHDNRIAVRFAYEWHDDSGNWFRSYGNENWEFDDQGLMRAPRQHQRLADTARRAQIPLAARSSPRRSPLALGSRALRRFRGLTDGGAEVPLRSRRMQRRRIRGRMRVCSVRATKNKRAGRKQ